VGLLPLVLVIGGGVLAVYGANRWLEARTEELERPSPARSGPARPGRRPGALAVKVGALCAAVGAVLLAADIVIHTVLAVLSLVVTVIGIVAVIAVVGWLVAGRRSSSG
jgi:hypothetical protein